MQQAPRARQRTVGRVLGALGLWAAVGFWAPSGVLASVPFLPEFNATYGTAGTRLNTCLVCHTTDAQITGDSTRNPYGTAFGGQQGHAAQIAQALQAIESLNSDNGVPSATNIVEIIARSFPGNANDEPPLANAGPGSAIDEGALVTLDGSNSFDQDAQGPSTVTFFWTQTAGPAVTLSSRAAARPTFTAPSVGPGGVTLTFELRVTDNEGSFATTSVNITVSNINLPPIVNAGPPQTVGEGVLVTLDGSQSFDPDGSQVTFAWRQVAGPPVTLTNPLSPRPTFIAPNIGGLSAVLEFELRVTDAEGLSATGSAFVNVSTNNLPPIPNAGPSQSVVEVDSVTLDGSQSRDPEGTPLTFLWRQVAGLPVTLSNPTSARPTFIAPAVDAPGAILQFELRVTDAQGLVAAATAVVQVLNDDGTRDQDIDGVSDAIEDGAPNNGDGNNDGIPDKFQANVVSLRENVSGNYLTLVTPAGTRLVDVRMVDNPSPSDVLPRTTFPLGFLSFKIQGVPPGAATSLTILTPPGVQMNAYHKYGRTPALPFNQWYRFVFDNTTGAEVGTDRVVLHFVDGQRGDDDLSADGTIVDVGALALQRVLLSDNEGGAGSGGGGGGCAMRPGASGDFVVASIVVLMLVFLGWRHRTERGGRRRTGSSPPWKP